MSESLVNFSNALAAVVERTGKVVVAVHGRPRVGSSGVVWKPGVVVTAEHALRREDDIRVTLGDGSSVAAELAGRDPGTDLAVLKLAGGPSEAIEINEAPQAGNLILAVGRTAETGHNATLGIVSAVGPGWQTWRGGRVDRYVRLDLQLYNGSSGGAIVDANGKLIGIATPILSRIAPLAIPAITVNRVVGQLLEKGWVPRGYLGVGLQPIALPEHLKTKLGLRGPGGLIVMSVEEGAAAAKAGIVIGDIFVALNGHVTGDPNDVQAALGAESIGKSVGATIVRGGEKREISLVVSERPRGTR